MIKALLSARRASRIMLIALELLPYFQRIIAAADRISGLSGAERRSLVIGCAQSVEARLDSIARDDAEQHAGERISGELDEITPSPQATTRSGAGILRPPGRAATRPRATRSGAGILADDVYEEGPWPRPMASRAPDSSRVSGTFAWPTGESSPSSSPSSGGPTGDDG